MNEEWREVKNYNGYKVSNFGRVYSMKVSRLLKPHPDKKGYLRVKFWKDGKGYTFKVHRLVAQAFIPNPHNYPQVNHKDENKTNNIVDNLEWCDNTYNAHYGSHIERATKNLVNRKNLSLPVLCVETGKVYPSIMEARRQTGLRNIDECCRGNRNTAGGFHWKYATNNRRIDGYMKTINTGNKADIGQKIYVPKERNGYTVQARDERYIICTKRIGKNVFYFIIDLKEKWRAPDDSVFCSGYETIAQCKERLKELQTGKINLSKRRGIPLDIDIS